MFVCAHANLGPFTHSHFTANTIGEAVNKFKTELWNFYGSLDGILDRTGTDNAPCVDLYYYDSEAELYSDECNSQMNFHDYPSARWQIGPRGGIRKVYV